MKIKCLILTALIFAVASISFAQTKTKAVMTADAVVKDLYAAQKTDKSPFFQAKDRKLVDKYFAKDLGDMIWKDSVDAKDGAGTINFDPLYYAQDAEIKDFVVGKPRDTGSPDNAFVKVTYKNFGKADWVDYELRRESDKSWKIVGIYYRDGEDLSSVLRYAQDEEFKKDFDSYKGFAGDYMVGKVKCSVTPTLNQMSYRVTCDGQEDFKLYSAEGDETETAYIYTDDKGAAKGKFVFKNGEANGKFVDESGKEMDVKPVK